MIQETIFGLIPSKSNNYLIGKNGFYKSKVVKDYEKQFYLQCKNRNKRIDSFFNITLKVYYNSMRPDLDGCFKVCMDCLQMCEVITNDNRCVKIHAEKFVDKKNPRIELTIEPINI